MFSLASNRRRIPLAVQLWTALSAGAIGLSLLVSTVVTDGRRREATDRIRAGSHRAAEALAQRAAPLLDRGDQLRLAVLAASVADVSTARVLIVDRHGAVCLDTGLSLGGQKLPIESSDGVVDRTLADGAHEIVHPALANSGFVGEVRLRYRPEVAAPGFAWDVLGVTLLGSMSLVVLAWWIVHHWVLQLRSTIERVRAIGTDPDAFEIGGRGAALGDLSSAAREVHAAIDEERRRAREAGLELARRLVRSLEQRGLAITGHGERTRRYALTLAEAIDLPADEWNDLGVAASLVDLGKAAVRLSALGKGPGISDVERESLRSAPARAASFLTGLPLTDSISSAIKHHREKWDGSGFPDGLRGDRIPLLARILSIADAYDLLTSDHEQCEALRWPDALDRLHEDRGEHFDPTLLDGFEAAIRRSPTPAATSESVVLAAARRSVPSCLPYKITEDVRSEVDEVEELTLEELAAGSATEFEVLRDERDADEESRG